jgi:hypothetical protein
VRKRRRRPSPHGLSFVDLAAMRVDYRIVTQIIEAKHGVPSISTCKDSQAVVELYASCAYEWAEALDKERKRRQLERRV